MTNVLTKIIFFSICFTFLGGAVQTEYTNNVPTEFKLIIDTLTKSYMSKEEYDKNKVLFDTLNADLKLVSKASSYAILKTEIYKEILRAEKKAKLDYVMINNIKLVKFEERILINLDSYNPFAKWLVNSLFNDFYTTVKNRYFATLKFRFKSKQELTSRELLVHKKKLEILYPWYQLIMNTEPEEFNLKVESILPELIHSISDYVNYYALYTSFEESDVQPLPEPIKMTWIEPEKEADHKEMDVVDKAIDELRETEGSGGEDWKPSDKEMATLVLPENYPTPDPGYKAPKELPKPINDWVFDF